ncbi:MAG TPA: DUF4011 domain-containing protein [Clostridia bacterium]
MNDIRVEFSTAQVINFCAAFNGAGIIGELYIENLSEQDIFNADITVSCPQGLIKPCRYRLDILPRQLKIDVNTLNIEYDYNYLISLPQIVQGEIILKIQAQGKELYSQINAITILPYDYWTGAQNYPEFLAGFVAPDNIEEKNLFKDAHFYLKKWRKANSFIAYQGGADRVLAEAAAVFCALKDCRLKLHHIKDNRETGQRINFSDALKTKNATITEAALIFASLLEKNDLNPILAVFEKYILVGAWLDDNTFSDCIGDDFAELSKKSALGELFLIDPKFLDQEFNADFNKALDWSKEPLASEGSFIYFIDIKRCRLTFINPVPKRVLTSGGWKLEQKYQDLSDLKPKKIKVFPVQAFQEPFSKQKYWERKLLDLTLKNSLLNFKITKNVLPVLADSLPNLAACFCNGVEYDILPIMKEAESLTVDFDINQGAKISSIFHKLLGKELSKAKLRSALDEGRLKTAITNIYRKYKYGIEENGVCTLYLALGLLKWYESENAERPLYAPLILIPLDLIRKSAKRYILKARDDETHFNITLLEMLRQQYSLETGGLDPLPKTSQNAIDVQSVFNIVRKLVMNQHGWDIIEESYISNFSFSGIVMWYDIRNRLSSLEKTPIVKGLISGIPFNKTALEVNDIDERWLKEEIILPIEADSSQLEAIYYANQDMSFVLHGPPGTGKSQTITNIIANALLKGKRVLFVAEKMAALSVVKNRLEEIGIGDFCLELHSDKTNKKDVLENLKKTSEIVKVYEPEDFKSVKDRLEKSRQTLAVYMRKLHQPQKYGFSLFEAIDEYISYDFLNQFELDKNVVIEFDKDKIEFLENKLYELKALGQDMGHPLGSDLEHINQTEYTLELKAESEKTVNKFLAILKRIRAYNDILSQAIDLSKIDSCGQYDSLMDICSYLAQSRQDTPHLESLNDDDLNKLKDFTALGVEIEQTKADLGARYNLDAFRTLNQKVVTDYHNSTGLKKALKKNKIINTLKKAALTGKYKDNFIEDYINICELQKRQKALKRSQDFVYGAVPIYKGKDYNYILRSLQEFISYKKSLSNSIITQDELNKLKSISIPKNLKSDYEQFKLIKAQLDRLLKIDFDQIQISGEWWLDALTSKALHWSMDSLKERCAYNYLRAELNNMGLKPVTQAYDNGLDHDMLVPAFRKAMLKAIIEFIISSDPDLCKYTGRLFEEKIRRFKDLEQKYRTVSRQLLSARLKMNLPNFDIKSSQMSELGIFQRAVKGSSRNITLKKLFEQIPNILPKVAPCMLMSPVTVAQYIDPQDKFDLLIFDEASQLTTAKAVGALSRAKTAIIVGDPKQLPPTSFFENVNSNEEDDLSEDLESVLDDCLALNMPEIHLRWHYRSKDESLIAFSNRQFYDNSLYTFPSPSAKQSAIKFIKVQGVYDRGRTKQNVEEALAVVEEVIKRLSHPETRKYSIGIVTFNIVQQNLIDDMLTETFRQSPRLEQYAMHGSEPLFVKNLENVQGDERDVILFSIGYGQDSQGKLSLNFGPLNREGGWRRLNVAVSRARREMIIFSSITYDLINPSATTAQGVKALRAFLEYAQKGSASLSYKASQLQKYPQGLEEQILNILKQKGYDGEINYGTSGYKINVAIKDPDNPQKFILGVMCDSISYSKVKTVKDREIAPFAVLKKLGWNLMRVWSLDFWDSPEKVINKIVKKIESLKKSDGILDDEEDFEIEQACEPKEAVIQNTLEAEYKPAAIPKKIIPSSYFSTELNQPHLIKITKTIIDTEYPVSYRTILKSVLNSSGIARSGSRIEAQMKHVLEHINCDCEIEGDIPFYWKKGVNKRKYNVYRINSNRSMDDISIYEIINGIRFIVQNQISLPKDALEQEVITLFGSKTTEEGLRQTRRAIRYGLENDIIGIQDGKIVAGPKINIFE